MIWGEMEIASEVGVESIDVHQSFAQVGQRINAIGVLLKLWMEQEEKPAQHCDYA